MSVERLNELIRRADAARADLEDARQVVDAVAERQRAAWEAFREAHESLQHYIVEEYTPEVLTAAPGMEIRAVS